MTRAKNSMTRKLYAAAGASPVQPESNELQELRDAVADCFGDNLQVVVQPSQAVKLSKEALTDLIAQHLSLTYHCTRVWSAWNVGTMSQDDFEPVDESDTPAEIADAIIAAINAKESGK